MEFSGTETGSINPEAWPRNVRGVGTHWIDHALIPADDPGLVERFINEVLDFKTAERVVESMEHPDGDRLVDVLRGVTARPRRDQGPERQAAPLRLSPGGLERDPAGR